ncbi:MAG: aminotransferase class III-fold pyridoxal phosphate-dependent enzyme [Burkholderiales bacterium]|nr:aminotransferase class III-fold pyridoxal phosphate-dependent enzyme [Burkholderiales bacterium]
MTAHGMRHEADSVLHSWCVPADWDAPTVVGGEGAWLLLEDGRRILDLSSLSECSLLGHQHPRLVQAIRDQAQTLCFVTNQWGARVRAELAEELLEVSGLRGGRVFFTLGGADANENAIKIARLAQEQPQGAVIARDRSYHGASYMGMALSGDARVQAFVDAGALNVHHVPPPYPYRCPFGTSSPEACGRAAAQAVATKIDAVGAQRTAAVIMEPNAGSNGIVPPGSFWPALRRVTRDRGVLLIADEVMSGFGRCGHWFAWQQHGQPHAPDLITCAKGLTGAAAPLGAVIVSAAVYERIERRMLPIGLTYCGHPLSCAAGLAAVRTYRDEGLIERSRRLGAWMFERLQRLQERHEAIGEVRGGDGLFAVVELVADRATRHPLAPWPQTPPALAALLREALAQGLSLASRGNLIILAPPLVIAQAELADAIARLDALLARHLSR